MATKRAMRPIDVERPPSAPIDIRGDWIFAKKKKKKAKDRKAKKART